jgi:hypothetical protein
MAKLERIELIPYPDWDNRMINGLIEIEERFGPLPPVTKLRAHLIDRTLSETQPQYALVEDEDLLIRPHLLIGAEVDLGVHRSEEAAIARCQEHHDSLHGQA